MYAEVTVVVEGAQEQVVTFHDETFMRAWIADEGDALESDGLDYAIYVQYHDHYASFDCQCAQFATDHRPVRYGLPEAHNA